MALTTTPGAIRSGFTRILHREPLCWRSSPDAMQSLALRRAIGSAAAFERHFLNQAWRFGKVFASASSNVELAEPSVNSVSHSSNKGQSQLGSLDDQRGKSFPIRATHSNAVETLSSSRSNSGLELYDVETKQEAPGNGGALQQSGAPGTAEGSGSEVGGPKTTAPQVRRPSRRSSPRQVSISGGDGLIAQPLGAHNFASDAAVQRLVDTNAEDNVPATTKYDSLAEQRRRKAEITAQWSPQQKEVPKRPSKTGQAKQSRKDSNEAAPIETAGGLTAVNSAKKTCLRKGPIENEMVLGVSHGASADFIEGGDPREAVIIVEKDDQNSTVSGTNGAAGNTGVASKNAASTESSLPQLKVNGKAGKTRKRKPLSPPAVESPAPPEASSEKAPEAVISEAVSNNGVASSSNGVASQTALPAFNNTVQPISTSGFRDKPAVGKQPATVRGAPLRDLLEENGIILPAYAPGDYRILCPKCKGGDSKEESLSVTINSGDNAVWHCFRGKCNWTSSASCRHPARSSSEFGGTYRPSTKSRESALQKKRFPASKVPRAEDFAELDESRLAFFKERKISEATLARNGVKMQSSYCPQLKEDVDAMAFPYVRRGEVVNVKYRDPEKRFWQVKGAEKVFYGLDDIADSKTVIIVEGEMDKLAMEEAGYLNCVSVPDGAPAKAAPAGSPLPAPEEDRKYEYLWNCREYIDKASRFLLATDSDDPGQALAEELARRLGREKCWRVKWPVSANGQQVKDANEALIRVGKSGLREAVEGAEAFPIRGLFKFESFFDEIDDYYNLQLGDERGVSTGWSGLDELYRIVPGELSVVTGVPNSGKSEWLDALLCNLVQQRGWNFALCSMENKVRDHARKLIEKFVGAPFFDAPYGEHQPRISPEQLERGKEWINQHFHVIRCEDDELPSIDWVLGLARAAVLRNGIRGLVIDPYNELDHQRPSRQTETEYVSQMLTKIKRFAQHHDCHVWFVAHPKQLQQWKGEAPGLYDISGSAHFVNKTDNGIVVHRNRDPETGPLDEVKILVRKVRNKAAGTIGEANLRYDRVTGRYEDVFF